MIRLSAMTVLTLFLCAFGMPENAVQQSLANQQKSGDVKIEPHVFEAGSGQKVEAELGRLLVPENRGKPQSNLIEIAFLRFKSTAKKPGPPIVYLAGGPGESGISTAKGPGFALFLALLEFGDVIALDQRGTGMSDPSLVCPNAWNFPLDKPGNPKEMLTIAKAKAHTCAQELKRQGIDLSGYNTNESADDIESLRVALGAKKINLWGISYGTHLALAVIRRHESSIGRVILTGVSGPDSAMLKLPSIIQEQLVKADRILKTDATLSKEAPDFIGLLTTLLDKLERNPVTVEVSDLRTGQKERVTLGKWDLQFFTASPITQTWGIKSLPGFYTTLSKGDFTPLARAALDFRKGQIGTMMPALMICASAASDERHRRIRLEAEQTLLGDALNFPFPEVCEALDSPDLGAKFRTPVKSNLPVLLISGTLDGRTPVSNAEEVRRGFPNSKHVIIEGASHGYDLFFFIPRVKEAMQEFLKQELGNNTN